MKVDPFIEAEKVAGHNVDRACDLLKVSKSAYYERRKGIPSARQLSDAEAPSAVKSIGVLPPIRPAFMTSASRDPSMAARPARTEPRSATSMRMMSKCAGRSRLRVRPLPFSPGLGSGTPGRSAPPRDLMPVAGPHRSPRQVTAQM